MKKKTLERSKYAVSAEEGKERARALLPNYHLPNLDLYERFAFRNIRLEEAQQAADIEQICFPPNEACSREHIAERVAKAPEFFLVAVDRKTEKIAGFLNGLCTDESSFRDEFFTDISLHNPNGKNIMLLGLDVLPEYRGQGLAREIMYNYLRRENEHMRHLVILTCLPDKVKMYKKMGFHDCGIAKSNWGGEQWHEMSCSCSLDLESDSIKDEEQKKHAEMEKDKET